MKLNSEEWAVLQRLLQKNEKLSVARAAYLIEVYRGFKCLMKQN